MTAGTVWPASAKSDLPHGFTRLSLCLSGVICSGLQGCEVHTQIPCHRTSRSTRERALATGTRQLPVVLSPPLAVCWPAWHLKHILEILKTNLF